MAAGCVIGVDLGGTKLLAGVVDGELRVHHRAFRLPRARTTRELIDLVVSEVREVQQAAGAEIQAVGLGIPSLMDLERGVAVDTVHLPLRDVPVRDLLAERLGLPVVVDNDATCAMLVEHRAGAARGARHALLLTIGTGIGGGIVVDGKVVRGASGAAGELGHTVIDINGPPCTGACRNRGCLEVLVSGRALEREARRIAEAQPESGFGRALAAGQEISGALATELAHDGDPAAREAVALIGRRLGVGISSFVNVFNPEVVVVGGGVLAAGDLLLEPARAEMAARALRPSRDVARIVPAHFGANAGMLGAAVLAMDAVRATGAAA